jgi:cytochrome c
MMEYDNGSMQMHVIGTFELGLRVGSRVTSRLAVLARGRWARHAASMLAAIFGVMAANASVAADETLIAYGEYLSGECVTCHQLSGAAGGIPSITGWNPDHFTAVLAAYRDKSLANEAMQTIAGRLMDNEIAALAAFFATAKK